MLIPILTGVQNEPESHRNDSAFLLKNVLFLKLLFHNEGHLYANFLFYILTIYRKYFLFQFLCCAIRRHIPILTGFQNQCRSHQTDCFSAEKRSFYGFISVMKVTCMPNVCSIFWPFTLNVTVFISLVVAYVCTFPS